MRHLREILHAAILAAPLGCGGSSLRLPTPADAGPDAGPDAAHARPDAAELDRRTAIDPALVRRYVDPPEGNPYYCGLTAERAICVTGLAESRELRPEENQGVDDKGMVEIDLATLCPRLDSGGYGCLDVEATQVRRATYPAACCYRQRERGGMEGRALVDRGASVVARVRGSTRDGRARRWLRAGLGEHASIPSFRRAAEELRRVDAPSSLIDGCLAGARDEARHAAACFGLASRYAGKKLRPEPLPGFPARPGGIPMITKTTFVEAAVPETIAVLRAEAELLTCDDAEERDVLAMVVADETRHAALAWQTLAWARTQVDVKWPALRRRPARVWREVIDPLLAVA